MLSPTRGSSVWPGVSDLAAGGRGGGPLDSRGAARESVTVRQKVKPGVMLWANDVLMPNVPAMSPPGPETATGSDAPDPQVTMNVKPV